MFYACAAHADISLLFKNDDGSTKWQHVANFSGSVLITLLSITAISLFFSFRRSRKANRALNEIRGVLEQRVMERTATLDKSNRLLTESNLALEGEIAHHKQTSKLLRGSEAYIKNILQSMPSMLIGLDDSLNVTQWNRCAEEITGIENSKAIGANLWGIYPTITIAPEQVRQVLTDNHPVTIKHSQRGQYYFDIRIFPLSGEIDSGVVILIDNVTARTLTENMLIQRDKMSSMGELAATMAHDIEIPLQAILEDMKIVQTGLNSEVEDSEKFQTLLADAEARGKQASRIINNLLEFSRSHGDEKRPADVTKIIDHSIELAKNTLSEPTGLKFQDIIIEREYEKNLPKIPAYVSELQQMFLSILRHACHAIGSIKHKDFTPKININIIECYDAIWIKIQHNGLGLTAEEQQEIFEPFFNASNNSNVEAEHRLSFSHFIVAEHHKGQIAITSDVNVGTTFHLQFQLK
ncbi:MAG: PAS domain S-box-containing protein [Lentisphaeria bacterium]|jgi:PAS domain S-box-containing protein